MTCVALGGSRHASRLNNEVRARMKLIVDRRFRIVIGDANGADKAFQKFLADRAYPDVEVFCSGRSCRNNLGDWECRNVPTNARTGTFEFFAAKDRAMAEIATVGFMLWDGESVGTMVNVWRLMRQRKSSLVYVQAQRRFLEIRGVEDWRALLGLAAAENRRDIDRRIRGESVHGGEPDLPLLTADLQAIGL